MNATVQAANALPTTIPEYLDQLRRALAGADPALVQDALYDAEEYLRSELAEQAGLSARVISDLERGVIRAPRPDTLEMLADALGLDEAEQTRWEQIRRRLSKRDPRTASAPASMISDVRSNLPTPLTPLVGRQREVAELRELLRQPAT